MKRESEAETCAAKQLNLLEQIVDTQGINDKVPLSESLILSPAALQESSTLSPTSAANHDADICFEWRSI